MIKKSHQIALYATWLKSRIYRWNVNEMTPLDLMYSAYVTNLDRLGGCCSDLILPLKEGKILYELLESDLKLMYFLQYSFYFPI